MDWPLAMGWSRSADWMGARSESAAGAWGVLRPEVADWLGGFQMEGGGVV